MDRDNLERLAANPHYKMTEAQLSELRRLQAEPVRHDTTVPRHDPSFATHPTKPKKHSDAEAH